MNHVRASCTGTATEGKALCSIRNCAVRESRFRTERVYEKLVTSVPRTRALLSRCFSRGITRDESEESPRPSPVALCQEHSQVPLMMLRV